MEQAEERIIDLVEVVREGKPAAVPVLEAFAGAPAVPVLTPAWEETIARLVREEVERLCHEAVQEKIHRLVREVLAREVEKALAREIEALKQS